MRPNPIHVTLLTLVAIFTLGLAAPPAMAEDDGLRTAMQLDLRSRRYPGEDERNVIEKITRVFELAQADYRIVFGKHGVIAYRTWGWETIADDSIDLGLSGEAYWYVDAAQDGDDVIVRVRQVPRPDPNTPLEPEKHEKQPGRLISRLTLDPESPLPGEDAKAAALYAVFFNRLDVLLGQNRFWLYCRAAEEYAKMEKLTGGLEAWCVDAGDARPGAVLAN